MSRTRSAEIVGGGFAGLAAACALAQRGWCVRLHERAERLRTAGAGINVYENGLRVLEALGALEETLADNARHLVRETRDQHDRLLSTHPWHIGGGTAARARRSRAHARPPRPALSPPPVRAAARPPAPRDPARLTPAAPPPHPHTRDGAGGA